MGRKDVYGREKAYGQGIYLWIGGDRRETVLFDVRLIPMPCADTVSFVYMGMEDGTDAHLGLIRSFAGLHEEYPDVCLYILGEHQMSEETEKEIRDLQLGENVFLMGSVDDPSILIEKCQCTLIPDQISTDGSGEILHTFMERVR